MSREKTTLCLTKKEKRAAAEPRPQPRCSDASRAVCIPPGRVAPASQGTRQAAPGHSAPAAGRHSGCSILGRHTDPAHACALRLCASSHAPRPMHPFPCSPPASTPGAPPCLRPLGEPCTESEIGKRGSRQSFLLRNSVAMPQGRWQEAAGPEHPNSTPKAAFTGIIISPSIFGLGVKGDLYAADRGSRRWRAVQPTCTLPLHQTHTLLHPFQGWKCQGQRRSRGRQP